MLGEPRFTDAQALALHRLGRPEEAVAVLARDPRRRDSLVAPATIERDRGRLAEAERHAATAPALDPADRDAAALVAHIRARR
jgi:hypothetical protein